jgi:hypothetical protein
VFLGKGNDLLTLCYNELTFDALEDAEACDDEGDKATEWVLFQRAIKHHAVAKRQAFEAIANDSPESIALDLNAVKSSRLILLVRPFSWRLSDQILNQCVTNWSVAERSNW